MGAELIFYLIEQMAVAWRGVFFFELVLLLLDRFCVRALRGGRCECR